VAHPVADQLEKHLTTLTERARLDETRRQFLKRGVVQVPFLAPEAVKELLAIEVEELVTSHGRRRVLVFPATGNWSCMHSGGLVTSAITRARSCRTSTQLSPRRREWNRFLGTQLLRIVAADGRPKPLDDLLEHAGQSGLKRRSTARHSTQRDSSSLAP
jgi:hypothetical protein